MTGHKNHLAFSNSSIDKIYDVPGYRIPQVGHTLGEEMFSLRFSSLNLYQQLILQEEWPLSQ